MVNFVAEFSAEKYSGFPTVETGVGVVVVGELYEFLQKIINSGLIDQDRQHRTSI